MSDDVVARIDALPALSVGVHGAAALQWSGVMTHAKDEIMALRAQGAHDADRLRAAMYDMRAHVRAEALEEAAQMCLRAHPQSNANAMGHAIRALKDRPT